MHVSHIEREIRSCRPAGVGERCPPPYLSLLADDGDSILELDVVEKALQEDVGHSDQVVVLLRFVERVAAAAVFSFSLVKQIQTEASE